MNDEDADMPSSHQIYVGNCTVLLESFRNLLCSLKYGMMTAKISHAVTIIFLKGLTFKITKW